MSLPTSPLVAPERKDPGFNPEIEYDIRCYDIRCYCLEKAMEFLRESVVPPEFMLETAAQIYAFLTGPGEAA